MGNGSGALKFAWKMKTWAGGAGIAKVIKMVLGRSLQ